MAQLRRSVILVLSAALVTGCYEHHLRPGEPLGMDASAPSDGGMDAGRDAGPPVGLDAGVDACVGPDCDIAADFDGLRWELPCISPEVDRVCDTPLERMDSFVARGPIGARYAVTLRFRGVVETAEYNGGTRDGFFHVGGRHYEGAWNLYALDVAAPRQTYHLNSGPEGEYFCVPIDYVRTVEIDVGSRVQLLANSVEERQIVNRDEGGDPIVVPDVDPAPEPFDGQFIQMDVVSVTRIR